MGYLVRLQELWLETVANLFVYLCAQSSKTTRENVITFNVVVALLWVIWLQTNNCIFRRKQRNTVNAWEDICNLIGLWNTSRHKLFNNYNPSTISLNV